MDIREKIEIIPSSPGVYFFKDSEGKVIYIGKAARLRERIKSHFAAKRTSVRAGEMISLVRGIDYMITACEEEALLCEAQLIKKYKPRFNILSRDDKAYPLLKLTVGEEYPRLFIARRRKKDDALYFGPFTNAGLLKQALALMRKVFPLRTCRIMPKNACLNYHLKQCPAPCINKANKEAYRQVVKDVILFLEGERKQLLGRLNKRMMNYAVGQQFEKAAFVRDQIKALTSLSVPQREYREALKELKQVLKLKSYPARIEAFDISNYAGREAVGAAVSFFEGLPDKANYRRFKIKFVKKIDDYAMMKEVIKRRFRHFAERSREMPDLLIIDGGAGHLSAVNEQLKEIGLAGIQAAAIAKECEQLYTLNKRGPIDLFLFPRVLFLVQRVRDEAHRFAIGYHHKLRLKQVRASVLDQIPGVGEKRKQILLKEFNSVNKIRESGVSDLTKLPAIDEKLARRIIEYLKR